MPSYAFRCEKCNKRFKLEMSISEYKPKEIKCKKCGSSKVVRVYEPFVAKTSKKS